MGTRDDGTGRSHPRGDRVKRLEAALRDNLKKRKELARERQGKASQSVGQGSTAATDAAHKDAGDCGTE